MAGSTLTEGAAGEETLWMRTGRTGLRVEAPGPERRRRRREQQRRTEPTSWGVRAGMGGGEAARAEEDEKMGLLFGLLWLFTSFLQGVHGQGVYGKDVSSTSAF